MSDLKIILDGGPYDGLELNYVGEGEGSYPVVLEMAPMPVSGHKVGKPWPPEGYKLADAPVYRRLNRTDDQGRRVYIAINGDLFESEPLPEPQSTDLIIPNEAQTRFFDNLNRLES